MPNPPISVPAGFAPAFALGYSDAQSRLTMVTASAPLPVSLSNAATPPAPLTGQTAAAAVAGPFNAVAGLPVIVALSGSWTGTVQVLRSTDGGVTKLPLRVGGADWGTYHESGVEQAWVDNESGVSFYLDITPTSGTVAYRVSQ